MKNWALLLASVVVVTSALTLRAQVDQGADMGGGADAGAVDNGGADTGGGGFGGGGGGGNQGNQGNQGGRGGRTRGGQAGQQGGRQGRQQQGQGQQQQGGIQQGGIQQLGQQQGGQQFNPANRNLLMIQQALTSPDEEWAILQPKVQALLDAQNLGSTNVRGLGGFGGGGGGRGGRGQGGQNGFGNQPAIDASANPVAAAQLDLETTLQDVNASDELIRVKLKTLRDAKAKVKSLLTKAQDDLREYLTLRQEAVLIQYGYMD